MQKSRNSFFRMPTYVYTQLVPEPTPALTLCGSYIASMRKLRQDGRSLHVIRTRLHTKTIIQWERLRTRQLLRLRFTKSFRVNQAVLPDARLLNHERDGVSYPAGNVEP